MYELFLKSHLAFSLALAGSLWFHIRLAKNITVISLGIASALWLTHHIAWLIRLMYRNFGASGFTEKVTFAPLHKNGLSQATRATITLTRPWKVVAGQYIYLTLPTEARHRLGLFQSHPYLIAWADESRQEIILLIQKSDGFSNAVFSARNPESSALVDGPYGHSLSLDGYDKVLFIASGIGISAHLLAMKHLLEAHRTQSARIRRLTLVWFLETSGMHLPQLFLQLLTVLRSRRMGYEVYSPSIGHGV
jgi:predicted ferric reductase